MMKKLLLLMLVAVILGACGNDQEKPKVKEASNEKPKEAVKEVEKPEVKEENTETDSKVLQKVGDKIVDTEGGVTVELLGIKEPNEIIELNTVKMTINSIKLIHMSDIKNADLMSNISQLTEKKEFDYIQIQYDVENTTDDSVRLNSPIEAVVLNTGEQIKSHEKDFSFDPLFADTLYGKVKSESMVTLIIEKSKAEDIDTIKIVTGRIDNTDGGTLVDEKIFDYKIK